MKGHRHKERKRSTHTLFKQTNKSKSPTCFTCIWWTRTLEVSSFCLLKKMLKCWRQRGGKAIWKKEGSLSGTTVSLRERPAARTPYRFVVIIVLLIIQKPDGADPVHRPLVPGLFWHVMHQALQGAAAGQVLCRTKTRSAGLPRRGGPVFPRMPNSIWGHIC